MMENSNSGRTMQMQLHNGTLVFESMGKRYKIAHVARSIPEANAACLAIPNVGLIDSDELLGLYFIAENNCLEDKTK
jgi:hypothetical protein